MKKIVALKIAGSSVRMSLLKKFLSSFAILSSLLAVSPAASAWDGVVSGKLVNIDVAPGGNYGFRITFAGAPPMCAGGPTWSYLNDTDSNYKTFVAVMLLAKAQGNPITVFTTLEAGYCHIGYISTSSS